MGVRYSVKIYERKLKRLPSTLDIAIAQKEIDHFSNSPYYKVWGKGKRLYFMPTAPSTGLKLTDENVFSIADKELIECVRRFVGEYSQLRYDEGLGYEYIDTDDRIEDDVPEEIIEASVPEIIRPAEGITDKLNAMLLEYVLADNTEAAKAIARVLKLIKEDN